MTHRFSDKRFFLQSIKKISLRFIALIKKQKTRNDFLFSQFFHSLNEIFQSQNSAQVNFRDKRKLFFFWKFLLTLKKFFLAFLSSSGSKLPQTISWLRKVGGRHSNLLKIFHGLGYRHKCPEPLGKSDHINFTQSHLFHLSHYEAKLCILWIAIHYLFLIFFDVLDSTKW